MTPPEATRADQIGQAGDGASAVFLLTLETLAKRSDFLALNKARRQFTPGFTLQARRRPVSATNQADIRVGFTCSKKLGNAVNRNRAKRRLREIARDVLPLEGKSGWDYVLIGKPHATAARDFADLTRDLSSALKKIHS